MTGGRARRTLAAKGNSGKAIVDVVTLAPSPPNAAHFDFLDEADASSCGYVWTRKQLTLGGVGGLQYTFDMRLTQVAAAAARLGDKSSVAYIVVHDDAGQKLENYLWVTEPANASIYEQWSTDATNHPISNVPLNKWIHVDFVLDAKSKQAALAIDGEIRSQWSFGPQTLGDSLKDGLIGVGYACTTIGGAVEFDNVLLTMR